MTIEELKEKVINPIMSGLGENSDQGTISETLKTLTDDYTERLSEIETSKTQLTELEKLNESMRTANNKFVNMFGGNINEITGSKPIEKPIETKPEDELSYENLFENGVLK